MKIGIKKIKLENLFVDTTVQRGIAKASLNKKCKEFDLDAVGILIVSKRKNGKYHILDGQHRFLAAKENGIEELDCEVHINLTEKEEAELFLKYNQERVSTKPIDHFNIEVKAGEETSVVINNILNEFQLNVSRRGVQAPKALKQVYKYYGEENLRKTIKLINNTWGIEGLKAPVIVGVANFIELGGAYIEYDRFVNKLQKGIVIDKNKNKSNVFESFKLLAERAKVIHHYSANEAYCHVICTYYNKMVNDRTKWVTYDPMLNAM